MFLMVACGGNHTEQSVIARFDAYLEALNEHNIDKALSYLSDDFVLTFWDYDMTMTREQVIDIMKWDAGVNGQYERGTLLHEDSTLTGVFTESNDFLKLIGISELKSRITYTFDSSGLISKQLYYSLPGQPSFQEKMKPAVEWARQNRPEELAEIYPDDQMVYTEEMGRRWVKLLREWRDAAERAVPKPQ